jgi:hypothetical protein
MVMLMMMMLVLMMMTMGDDDDGNNDDVVDDDDDDLSRLRWFNTCIQATFMERCKPNLAFSFDTTMWMFE